MLSKYTVLQFLPNPTSGERVNIGIIAYNQIAGHVRFLSKWDRVKAFAGSDISFLKDLSKEVIARVESYTRAVQDKYVPDFQAAEVESWVAKWSHGIEFTEPRASTKDPIELLNDLCVRMLEEPVHEKPLGRDRAFAARAAAFGLRAALEEAVGDKAEDLLKKRYRLDGKHQTHRFDAAIANGVPYAVATGVSFEIPYSERAETFYDSLAWAISDVAAVAQAIPVAVLALQPLADSKQSDQQWRNFESKRKLYTDLGADFLTENDYPNWAEKVVARLPLHAASK